MPIARRPFEPADLDEAWLVVAAATPEANREVAAAAEARRIFVNAVDDPANATAFLSGVVRRDGVTIAISTSGDAPALTALLREALDAVLPADLERVDRPGAPRARSGAATLVPMDERRPLLLEALNPSSAERLAGAAAQREPAEGLMTGHVSIVGAGPGDPELLTRKAVARLRAADLVLYDALVDVRVLDFARRAQRFFVGKRAGRHAMTQTAIHALMIRAARKGRRVVRLKGGDPFVFGRGGEEALALRAAGVPFDVVPGDHERRRGAGARRDSGDAPRPRVGLSRRQRPRRGGVCVRDRPAAAQRRDGRRADGRRPRGGAGRRSSIDRGWSRGTPAAMVCARVDAASAGVVRPSRRSRRGRWPRCDGATIQARSSSATWSRSPRRSAPATTSGAEERRPAKRACGAPSE